MSKPKLGRLYLLPKTQKRLHNAQVDLLFQIMDFLRETFQHFGVSLEAIIVNSPVFCKGHYRFLAKT